MRLFALMLIFIVILVACGPEAEQQPTATIQAQPTNTGDPEPSATEAIAEESVEDLTPTEPSPTLAPMESPTASNTPPPVETPTEVVATEVPDTPTIQAAVINGPYENTYFRGSSSAPITMIDYSDFL